MIARLAGTLVEKSPAGVILDAGGVGYLVRVSLNTFYRLPDAGEPAVLRVTTHVRDDAIELFGFDGAAEQRLFGLLTTVKGIGPRIAISILSGIAAEDLVAAIGRGDARRIQKVPGVGLKTAERICLELKEKAVTALAMEQAGPAPVGGATGAREDALSALLNLGYKEGEAERALKHAESTVGADADVPALLKAALKVLTK